MSEASKRQEKLVTRIEYVKFLYIYLLRRKPIELTIFSLITFLLPVVPYIWISAKLHLEHVSDEHLRNYYGDGSMITLCSGILCSYFAILFDFKSSNQKSINILINILLIFAFFVCLFLFERCQMSFIRDWFFIKQIFFWSSVLLFVTFCTAIYLNFDSKIDYQEVIDFKNTFEGRETLQKASNTLETGDGVKL